MPGPVPRQLQKRKSASSLGRAGPFLSSNSRATAADAYPHVVPAHLKKLNGHRRGNRSIQVAALLGGLLSFMNSDLQGALSSSASGLLDTDVLIEAGYSLGNAAFSSSELRLVFGAVVTVLLWEVSSQCSSSPRSDRPVRPLGRQPLENGRKADSGWHLCRQPHEQPQPVPDFELANLELIGLRQPPPLSVPLSGGKPMAGETKRKTPLATRRPALQPLSQVSRRVNRIS